MPAEIDGRCRERELVNGWLFSVSYTASFTVKNGTQTGDYAVILLECLWWSDDMFAFITNYRCTWDATNGAPAYVMSATGRRSWLVAATLIAAKACGK